jgi:hypothetical protein
MRKYDAMLQVVRECDYRVLEGPASCGCQPPETRCLLGRGGWARDRNLVNPNDCLECTKMSDIEMRILNMQRLLQELLIRIVALENRLTTSEQQHTGLWY